MDQIIKGCQIRCYCVEDVRNRSTWTMSQTAGKENNRVVLSLKIENKFQKLKKIAKKTLQ